MKQSHRRFRALRCKFNHRSAQAGLTRLTGLVLLTGAMIAPPVQAGNYVLDRVETEDGEVYESESIPTIRPWTGNAPNSGSTSKPSIPSQSNYSVSVRSKGKIRSVFVWSATAQGPHNTPPLNDTLYVKVSPTTDVPIYLGYGTTATLSGLVVNNGFGDAPVNQGYGSSQRYVSRGVHLVAIKTNGQTELKTPFITMEGAVTLTGTTGYNTGSAGAGAYHTYLSEKTDRGILITSSIEDSWKKVTSVAGLPTKIDPNTGMPYYDTDLIDPNTPWDGAGPWRIKCVRALDGTMSVHSAADWFEPNTGEIISNSTAWFGRGIYDSNATGLFIRFSIGKLLVGLLLEHTLNSLICLNISNPLLLLNQPVKMVIVPCADLVWAATI